MSDMPPNGDGNDHASAGTTLGTSRGTVETRKDRLQPHSLEAEQAVLGAVLLDNGLMAEVAVKLRPSDFYRAIHRTIFQAMLDLFERPGKPSPIDYLTVLEAVARLRTANRAKPEREQIELVDVELDYLMELAERTPSAANALFYAEQVKQKALLRELIGVTNEINRECFDWVGETSNFLDHVEQKVFAITQRDIGQQVMDVRSVMKEVFKRLDQYQDRQGRLTGIPSGFDGLDALTGGFQDGEMIVLAARPSMGKTSMALSMVRHIALQEGISLVFFSCEMGRAQIVQNMLCAEARLNSRRLRSGFLDEYEYGKLVNGAGKLADASIFIDDTPSISLREVRAKCRRLAERSRGDDKIRIVFIDYLQLMGRPAGLSRNASREQEIAHISAGLKALARELMIPVIVLAQLNRDVEKRTGTHRPRMSDLRESGSIEQDADVILLLHREFYYTHNEEDKDKAEIIVAKNRNGPTDTVPCRFLQEFMRFDNPPDPAGAGGDPYGGVQQLAGGGHAVQPDPASPGDPGDSYEDGAFDHGGGIGPPI